VRFWQIPGAPSGTSKFPSHVTFLQPVEHAFCVREEVRKLIGVRVFYVKCVRKSLAQKAML
jgi:hypothetical protein